jgi:hypothetical protein
MVRFQQRSWGNGVARTPTTRKESEKREVTRPEGPLELGEARRKLASLALDWRHNKVLGLRQHEILRRTLVFAGKAHGWDLLQGSSTDRISVAKKDVIKMAKGGVDLLSRDMTETLGVKKTEMASLKKVVASVRELAVEENTQYPAEVQIAFTARNGLGNLITKNESLVLRDGAEATRAADDLERREGDRTRLRDEMVEKIKVDQRELDDLKKELPSFVEWLDPILGDVLAMPT